MIDDNEVVHHNNMWKDVPGSTCKVLVEKLISKGLVFYLKLTFPFRKVSQVCYDQIKTKYIDRIWFSFVSLIKVW